MSGCPFAAAFGGGVAAPPADCPAHAAAAADAEEEGLLGRKKAAQPPAGPKQQLKKKVAFAATTTDIPDACPRKGADDGGAAANAANAATAPPPSPDDSGSGSDDGDEDDGDDSDAGDDQAPAGINPKTTAKTKNPPPCPSDRDPASWFFEHQARCEADFQARRRELRALARERLRLLFRRQRGQELVRDKGPKKKPDGAKNDDPNAASEEEEGSDSDDSDWSVGDTELSAWDSDVASLLDQGSLAESAAQEEAFEQPAARWLNLALLAAAAVGVSGALLALYASISVGSFAGVVLARAWVPKAAAAVGFFSLAAAGWTWAQGERRLSRRGLALGHALLTLAVAGGCAVAALALGAPAMLDPRVRAACSAAAAAAAVSSSASVAASAECGGRTGGSCPNPDPPSSNNHHASSAYAGICGPRIEAYDVRLASAMRLSFAAGCAVALAAAAASACCVLRCWELSRVAQRAAKHRTRRRRRARNGKIPWHKLRIVGPVTTCGGGGGGGGGGCPFAAGSGAASSG